MRLFNFLSLGLVLAAGQATAAATVPSGAASSASLNNTSSGAVNSTGRVSMNSTGSGTTAVTSPAGAAPAGAFTLDNKLLILARDAYAAESGSHGLAGYGIPYENFTVPQSGFTLPPLNDGPSHGLYSGIIVMDGLLYDNGGVWASALSAEQWTTIHDYQVKFKARMVRINESPGPDSGTSPVGGGCCAEGVEQMVSLTETADFPTANLKVGAELSTKGLWHVPASVSDTATTKVVAEFGTSASFAAKSAAAVINTFADGREQFVWFMAWAPQVSATAAVLQHAHIHWVTRGLFLGKRKTHLSVQIDDLELPTDMYYPPSRTFRVRPEDLTGHVKWQTDLNARLPPGSDIRLELGHNGNGDLIQVAGPGGSAGGVCVPGNPVYTKAKADTELEFVKPLGTGEDAWGAEWTTFPWNAQCTSLDALTNWYNTPSNRDAFFHVSHTFTHLSLNNATYADAAREIQFNQAWMAQVGIADGHFSEHGLIPPAITGLHNGDVIKAWLDNGITHVVGDNTRPVLRASNPYHPLISTVAGNGYDGLVIVPRWATSIYFNCDDWECNVQEWKDVSQGAGTYVELLDNARVVNTPYLFALKADPYMFHQANMRLTDMPTITVGSQTGQMSLVMGWVEAVAQEVARVTNWPIVSLGHDDVAQVFIDRMTLDKCNPKVSYTVNSAGNAITHVTVSAEDLRCAAPIPVTIPSGSASGGSVTSDEVGSEPPILWVTLAGSPATLELSSPVPI